jgi:drug/metabolite transporter (DMT)-like permease
MKLFLTAFFWGGTFIAGRTIAGHVGPFSAAFLRFFIASSLLIALAYRMEENGLRVERRQIIPLVLLGLTGVFSYNMCFFKGLERIEAGRASLIIATNPVFISLLSSYFFRERLTLLKLAGILLSVSGAVVVISRGEVTTIWSGGLGWGEVFIFGCVLSWVAYSLIGKVALQGLSPLIAVTWSAIIGTCFLLLPVIREGMLPALGGYRFADWASISYLGVFGTVIGFVWYYQGIKSIGPSRASLFINFVPISAIVLAYLILSEPVTLSLAVGTVMVLAGVWLTNRPVATASIKPARVSS